MLGFKFELKTIQSKVYCIICTVHLNELTFSTVFVNNLSYIRNGMIKKFLAFLRKIELQYCLNLMQNSFKNREEVLKNIFYPVYGKSK